MLWDRTAIFVKIIHWNHAIIFTQLRTFSIKICFSVTMSSRKSISETNADLPTKWNINVTNTMTLIKPNARKHLHKLKVHYYQKRLEMHIY